MTVVDRKEILNDTTQGFVIEPGKNVSRLINDAKEKALRDGVDPNVAALRAIMRARRNGELAEAIKLDTEEIVVNPTSVK